jgi:hypothetical protein
MKQINITAFCVSSIIFTVLFLWSIFYLSSFFIDSFVTTPRNIVFDQWLQEYKDCLIFIGVSSVVWSLFWFVNSHIIYKVTSPNNTGLRFWWVCGFVLHLVTTFTIVYFAQTPAQEGQLAVIIIFFLFTLLGYYVPTVFFTAPAYKYAPVGASAVRKKW